MSSFPTLFWSFLFSPSVVSQDSEGGGVSRGKQTDKLSLQQGKEKGEKTEYKLEEGKLSSTTPLESQVHERTTELVACFGGGGGGRDAC